MNAHNGGVSKWLGGCLLGATMWTASLSCAPTIKRDLSKVPAGQIGFDDMCGLQSYFDDIEARKEPAATLVSSTEFETNRQGHALRTGRSRFAFQGRAQLSTLRRILDENWNRLPEGVVFSPRVDLDVYWSERDGLRRVASNQDARVIAGGDEVTLPYHVCLSELLYGAPLYHQRREVMGMPPITPLTVEAAPLAADRDAGAAQAGSSVGSDGGVTGGAAPDGGRRPPARAEIDVLPATPLPPSDLDPPTGHP
jgi:hypothetical protein